jgi:Site-specific recombinases, DNA invertase Pin homologs
MLFNITRSAFLAIRRPIRVAAYCRVSSAREEQLHSLATQEDYYNELVQQHRNWTLVNIYTDTASGRSVAKRKAFQSMLEACRHDEIDLIITKSISRFGRNTVGTRSICC